MGQYKNNFYEINIKKHKYKNNHPIYQIQNMIEQIYINRYKLIKNICNSKNETGFYLISKNNNHYEQITNIMKKLIKISKECKNFKLNINHNIKLYDYTINYDINDKYDNYTKYISKEIKICKSLYIGINNFIYYIINILENKNKFNNTLLSLTCYKKIVYNLNIINRTLDNKLLSYYLIKNVKCIDLDKKLLLNISVLYVNNHKINMEEVKEIKVNKYNKQSILLNIYGIKYKLPKNIDISQPSILLSLKLNIDNKLITKYFYKNIIHEYIKTNNKTRTLTYFSKMYKYYDFQKHNIKGNNRLYKIVTNILNIKILNIYIIVYKKRLKTNNFKKEKNKLVM